MHSHSPTRLYSPHVNVIIPSSQITFFSSCQINIPCAVLLLLFLYVNLTITMNTLSSKVHFLAQTRQTKRRTNRTRRTQNQRERERKRKFGAKVLRMRRRYSALSSGRYFRGTLREKIEPRYSWPATTFSGRGLGTSKLWPGFSQCQFRPTR